MISEDRLETNLGTSHSGLLSGINEEWTALENCFWKNVRISSILESVASLDVNQRISRNLMSMLHSFFRIKSLWTLEYEDTKGEVIGFNFGVKANKKRTTMEGFHSELYKDFDLLGKFNQNRLRN